MVRLLVALIALLAALLVLAGPVAAEDDGDAEASADGSEDSGSEGSAESGDAEGSEGGDSGDAQGSGTDEAQSGDSSAGPAPSAAVAQRTCRVSALYVLDPRVPPSQWVEPDPDGCIRRTVERALGPPLKEGEALLKQIRQRIPL